MAVFKNELQLDVGPLLDSLNKAVGKAKEAGDKIGSGLGDAIKAGSDEAKLLGAAFDGASNKSKASVESLKKSIATLIVSGQGSGDVFDAMVADLKKADEEAKKLQKALKEVDALTIDPKIEIDSAEISKQADGIAGKLQGVFDKFGGGGIAGDLLGGFVGGGAFGAAQAGISAVGDALGSVVEKGRALIAAQGDLAAQTGLTGAALDKLNEQASVAFRGGVGESLAEATKIIGNVQQQLGDFLPADQLGTFAARAQALGNLYDKDVNEVIAKSTPFIKQFGLNGDEAFNLIALASKDAKTSQDDVLDSLSEYSQLLVQAGFTATDFVGALSVAGQEGLFNTDKIADAIKEAQIRLKAGDISKTLQDLNAQLPATLRDTIGSLTQAAETGQISIKEYLQRSGAAIEEGFAAGQISESLRSSLQVAIAGTPAEDIGTDVYGKIFGAPLPEGEIIKRAQAAGQAAAGAIGQYLSFDGLIRGFDEAFEKVSAGILKAFDFVLQFIGNAVSGPIGEAIESISTYFSNAWSIIEPILMALSGVLITVVVAAIDLVVSAFRLVSSVAVAVFDGIVDALSPLINAIKAAFGMDGEMGKGIDVVQMFMDYLKGLGEVINIITEVLIGVGKVIVEALMTPLQMIGNALAFVINKIREWVGVTQDNNKEEEKGQGILETLRVTLLNMRGTIGGVVEAFRAIKDAVADFFSNLASLNVAAAIESFTKIGEKTAKAYNEGFNEALNPKKQEQEVKKQGAAVEDYYQQLRDTIVKASKDAATQSSAQVSKTRIDLVNLLKKTQSENKITAQQAKELDILIKNIRGKGTGGKKIAEDEKSAYERAQESLKNFADEAKRVRERLAIELRRAGADAGEIKTKLALLERGQLVEYRREAEKLFKIEYKDGLPVGTTLRLNADKEETRKDVLDAFEQILLDIDKRALDLEIPVKPEKNALIKTIENLKRIFAPQEVTKRLLAGGVFFGIPLNFQAPTKKEESQLQKSILSGIKTAADSIKGIDWKGVFQVPAEESKKATDEVTGNIEQGLLTYQEGIDQLADKLVNIPSVFQKVLEQLNAGFAQATDTSIQALNKQAEAYDTQVGFTDDFYTALYDTATNAFAQLLTAQGEYGKNSLLIALDILSALVPILVAEIVGKELADKTFIGLATGAALSAVLYGLLGAAKASVSGFAEGGYTGDGGKYTPAGIVHRGEFVINKENTRKYRGILEQMNDGKFPLALAGVPTQSNDGLMTEMGAMRSELAMIRKRLDSMPNGIEGRTAVNLDVGFDTYLYQRNMRRAAVRNLRG